MNHTQLLSRCVTLAKHCALKHILLLALLATGCHVSNVQAAMIDAIDIQQRGGETYVYLHTNEAIEHESHVVNRHSISVILDDVSVFGGQLPIHYEHAPSIKNVMLEHTGPKQITLSMEGKSLKAPIIGFRESSVVPVNTSRHAQPAAVASNFLALATPSSNAAPASAVKNTALQGTAAVMPTALESTVMQPAIPQGTALNSSYTDAVLQKVGVGYIALLKWAKAHRFLLTMILLAGVSTLFVLNFVSRLVFAKLERNTPAPPQQPELDAQHRSTLGMQGMAFSPKPSATSGVSYPATPQPGSVNEHRLNRIREKMKQQGYAITPEAPAVETITPSAVDINMKVKAAIARRKSQQYQRAGSSPALPQLPALPPQQDATTATLVQPQQATTTPLAGNGFLHAMAEYMDTPSKEHIAKAIQQSKLKY